MQHKTVDRELGTLDQPGEDTVVLLVAHFGPDNSRMGYSGSYALAFDAQGQVASLYDNTVGDDWRSFDPTGYTFVRNPVLDDHPLTKPALSEKPIEQCTRGDVFLGGGGNWGQFIGRFEMKMPRKPETLDEAAG